MRIIWLFILLVPILATAVEPPRQTALQAETPFSVDLGGAKATVKVPAGAVVEVIKATEERITVKRGNPPLISLSQPQITAPGIKL